MYNQDQRLQAWIVVLIPLQVATGAAEMYSDEVQQIHNLSHHGTQQLLADLEYFCNVLAALGVALPVGLSTWQVITHHVLFWVPAARCNTWLLLQVAAESCSLFFSIDLGHMCRGIDGVVLADHRCCQSVCISGKGCKASRPPAIFANPLCWSACHSRMLTMFVC